MTKVITIFSCANDVHKIVIIRWRNVAHAVDLEVAILRVDDRELRAGGERERDHNVALDELPVALEANVDGEARGLAVYIDPAA